MALERVAFLPFGLLIDTYRYGLFNGTTPENQWNHQWETLRYLQCASPNSIDCELMFDFDSILCREKYQKIRSPGKRTEQHFDAGAKFHVPSDIQYVSYFLAHILEFQILRSVCGVAGQYDPKNATKALHKCDIGGSVAAGQRLRDGLSLGRSKHWSEALSKITGGDTEIEADALLEYFKPLHEFLLTENAKMRKYLPESMCHYSSHQLFLFYGISGSAASKKWYVIGGICIAVALIALISSVIYCVNKR